MKLGSLFDGSGGFPLAGTLCGIEPVWAAEVEPYPIAVTRSRFPKMKHLGDISKINGAEIEPVDIITFGSPCQDLSVAGKRAGLKHEANGDEETTRSGLFMEAVRIIKEMRKATNGRYPTFALWENVPGAFSSNKGEDFRIVCEELIKIVEPSAFMPAVPKNGWNYSDSYIGDGWSLAYRVFDAQYWGVPQRRRRIHLVVDFRGERAREILFEREGVRGYFTQGGTPWQGTPADAQDCAGADDREGESNGGNRGRQLDAVSILTPWDAQGNQVTDGTGAHAYPCLRGSGGAGYQQGYVLSECAAYGVTTKGNGDAFISEERHTALTAGGGQAGQGYPAAMVPYTLKIRSGCEGGGKGALIQEDKSATLATNNDRYLFQPVVFDGANVTSPVNASNPLPGDPCHTLSTDSRNYAVICMATQQGGAETRTDNKAPTITAAAGMSGNNQPVVCYKDQHLFENHGQDTRYKGPLEVCPIVSATFGMGGNNQPFVVERAGFKPNQGVKAKGIGYEQEASPTLLAGQEPGVVYCLQGNGIDRADTAGCNGKGWKEDASYTLNTIDRPAVCYRQGGFADYVEGEVGTLRASGGDLGGGTENLLTFWDGTQTASTLTANNAGGNQRMPDKENFNCVIRATPPHYIVRRLTPTECARLQGFADWWGHIEQKDSLTDEEYRFWLEVRNTHATINGKKVQDYTEKQMLAWYNKLWTDAAEYKMWGNGIALPPALYCLQGIVDAERKYNEQNRNNLPARP